MLWDSLIGKVLVCQTKGCEFKSRSLCKIIDLDYLLIINSFMIEYIYIFIFLILSFIISFIVFVLSYLLANQTYDSEKLSAYECGFQPFEDARNKFDIKFYLVAILFIIFDLEIAFLFPWAISLGNIGALGFWSMMIFLSVLTIGFIYEWKKGALEWE